MVTSVKSRVQVTAMLVVEQGFVEASSENFQRKRTSTARAASHQAAIVAVEGGGRGLLNLSCSVGYV